MVVGTTACSIHICNLDLAPWRGVTSDQAEAMFAEAQTRPACSVAGRGERPAIQLPAARSHNQGGEAPLLRKQAEGRIRTGDLRFTKPPL